ncbi:SWIM zinc finger family protein [Sphaerisporangium fuscum]|uniref:SWIM zinc finger family protein n=1 Tax=Sphaerisporangium fuscum TaxID=2835868 RepID=UPI001BDD2660|nr:SWIM zinc finger family protein [Sphaerisporangium fuscum]
MTSSLSDTPPAAGLPPALPHVVAAAVEGLTTRLRKKLDAAVEQYAAVPPVTDDEGVHVRCGEDAVVTLSPGPAGVVASDEAVRCSCLLAPRCLHRAAVLSACPVADAPPADPDPDEDPRAAGAEAERDVSEGHRTGTPPAEGAEAGSGTEPAVEVSGEGGIGRTAEASGGSGAEAAAGGSGTEPAVEVSGEGGIGRTAEASGESGAGPGVEVRGSSGNGLGSAPTAAQVAAAAGLWRAAAALLSAGLPAAGAVPQAELLRAAHTARLAGLVRAEAAALRVVRGVRAARARHDGHRLADLVSALRELLLTAGMLAAADPDPALIGTARRSYQPGGALRVHGVFREPVISATGYAGVVTHLVTDDGRWLSIADVKPGGSARARGAGAATVAIGSATVDHAGLARGGLLVTGATVSADGRLGAGRGVRATPVPGLPWSAGPLATFFTRPLGEVVTERLSARSWSDSETAETAREPLGCDLVILGAAGGHVLARQVLPATATPVGGRPAGSLPSPPGAQGTSAPGDGGTHAVLDGEDMVVGGPLVRLVPASSHPDLAHVANLRRLASCPGLLVRVVGWLEPDRTATLRPLAVGPVPGAEATLRLPPELGGHADLGYDRLQGAHLPSPGACSPPAAGAGAEQDPLADSPLWRVRRLVELAVTGGRRAAAEAARGGEADAQAAQLRRAGFATAARLATAFTAEADRRGRDVFGRLTDPGADGYAWAWLAAAVHLAATEHALVRASWLTGEEMATF